MQRVTVISNPALYIHYYTIAVFLPKQLSHQQSRERAFSTPDSHIYIDTYLYLCYLSSQPLFSYPEGRIIQLFQHD